MCCPAARAQPLAAAFRAYFCSCRGSAVVLLRKQAFECCGTSTLLTVWQGHMSMVSFALDKEARLSLLVAVLQDGELRMMYRHQPGSTVHCFKGSCILPAPMEVRQSGGGCCWGW
jgi:hypothetical protein